MPIKKWLFQYIVAVPAAGVFLGFIQFMKGRDVEYAVAFGALWGMISVTLFFATRIYYFRKNVHCKACRQPPLPESARDNDP